MDPDTYVLKASGITSRRRRARSTCEDYQAAATLDFAHDEADRREGRRIECPMLAPWGRCSSLEEWYDVVGI